MAKTDPPSKKDFFISYSKADRDWAQWIAWQLEGWGLYSVVLQEWDFGPGPNFVLEVDRAIQECEWVIALLSPDYLTSLFTKPEWAAYFVQNSSGQDRRFVPVRVRECDPKGLLAPIVYADLVGKPENEAKAILLDAVKLGRRKSKVVPSFPGRKGASKPRFPGAVPDIWSVPHLRNPNFIEPGRQLSEIHDAFGSGKPAALTQALSGLGGVGKTQLAIEYAYRYASNYAIVWWLRSEQAATLMVDYAALATALDLLEKDAVDQSVMVRAVRNALQHRRDWLLVFDGVNASEEIRDYLPAKGGHVLITSRHESWAGFAQTMAAKKWPSEVAVEFLLKRTAQNDAAAAAELARELDYLPLALEQIAAYIDSTQTTLTGYLGRFRERHVEIRQQSEEGTGYPGTVATTVDLSFERLEAESPSAALLLQLCAFLAPDDIPRDMISVGAEHLPEPLRAAVSDALTFDEVVRVIRRYSLIEVGEESVLSINRLVRARVRERLSHNDLLRWAEISQRLVTAADRLKKHAAALPLYFDADVYNAAEVAEVLGYFSDYYEVLAGDRLVIDSRGTLEPSAALVP